ncbi:MAG: formate dehydrogenase subunit gamma [Gammaproteobacteria bacterium]|nr:MAG: formate dehydrogenase subunit gamma [Gammaproteobacteria bacterium]
MARPDNTTRKARARRYKRIVLWSIAIILVGAMVLPLGSYVVTGIQPVRAQAIEDSNPRANYWRAVRRGNEGYTSVVGQETGVLIQNGGQNWRQLRNGPVATIGGWALFLVVLAIVLFFGVKGPVPLDDGRSGRTVARWSMANRVLHWYTAILFIVLAITGLSLLFGRAVLIPLLGPEGFAAWAAISKGLHNYGGPAFSIGVVLMLVFWARYNLPEKGDWNWLVQGGGLIGKGKHPPAGRVNAGEKIFTYGGMLIFGLAVVVTGFILDFPNFGQSRDLMQTANIIHGISSIIWMALMAGHIYLGSVGVEGAFEGMNTGRVDENWAKQHHSLWYEEARREGTQVSDAGEADSGAARGEPA